MTAMTDVPASHAYRRGTIRANARFFIADSTPRRFRHAAYEIVQNTLANLRSRNISSGFDFLAKSAGFDIIQSLIPYSSNSSYGRALFVGFLNTLLISAVGIIAATILGFVMGVMRLSRNWLVARVATLYIEIFRNVPLLLWIFILLRRRC